MDAHGLWGLRWHCITHRHDSVIYINKWAQEYFQKPLSVNTIRHPRALSCKKEAICEHGSEVPSCPVGQGSFKMDCFKVVLWSDESKFDILVGNHRCGVLRAKEEGDLSACYQRSVQKPASLMAWGCIRVYGMGSLHVLEGTVNAERYIKVLEQHILPSRWRVFQQDNEKPQTAALQQHDFVVEESGCMQSDLSPIENIWRIFKQKIRQRRPQTLQQLETYFREEWDQIPTPKLQKLITSMPRRFQTVLKRRGDATPWWIPFQLFWDL